MADLATQVEQLLKAAQAQGFATRPKRKGTMVLGQDGGSVMLHHTPSDWRGVRNARAALRKIGVSL
jgi:hypothetical protein